MDKLSKENIAKIKAKGLEIREFVGGDLFISKPFGTNGNFLPNARKRVQLNRHFGEKKDCPTMHIRFDKGIGQIEVWDYVPGPGPGDFTKDFQSSDIMTDFIINYYFTKNSDFQAKIEDDNDHRNAINVNEIKILLEKSVKFLEKNFGDEDIDLHRVSFNKIPLENWHKGEFTDEFSNTNTQHGMLSSEAFYLKRKRYENTEIEGKDLYRLAHILTELCIRTRETK